MKKLLLMLALIGCGKQEINDCYNGCEPDDKNERTEELDKPILPELVKSCSVKPADEAQGGGAVMTCPGYDPVLIKNGVDGLAGEPGESIQGPKGESGDTGPMGSVGPQGISGTPGLDAESCSVVYTAVGATFFCPNGTTVNILNGINGNDGSSVLPVRLCADSSAGFPEYGFQIGDGLFAVYYGYLDSNGNPSGSNNGTLQAFMAKLKPSNYFSTNGTGCTFTVNADGSITR